MNNIRFLICIIFTLLVGILVYLYVSPSLNNAHSDGRTIEQLKQDLADAQLRNDLNQPTTLFTPTTTPTELDEKPNFNKLLTLEEEKALAEEEKALAEEEVRRQVDELEKKAMAAEKAKIDAQIAANQPPPVSEARLELIAKALVMATVHDYDEPTRLTLLNLTRPENVVKGQILGIRRNKSGIIGRVKIASIQNGQAFADPIPASFFGKPVDIRVGDELIVIP